MLGMLMTSAYAMHPLAPLSICMTCTFHGTDTPHRPRSVAVRGTMLAALARSPRGTAEAMRPQSQRRSPTKGWNPMYTKVKSSAMVARGSKRRGRVAVAVGASEWRE